MLVKSVVVIVVLGGEGLVVRVRVRFFRSSVESRVTLHMHHESICAVPISRNYAAPWIPIKCIRQKKPNIFVNRVRHLAREGPACSSHNLKAAVVGGGGVIIG